MAVNFHTASIPIEAFVDGIGMENKNKEKTKSGKTRTKIELGDVEGFPCEVSALNNKLSKESMIQFQNVAARQIKMRKTQLRLRAKLEMKKAGIENPIVKIQ